MFRHGAEGLSLMDLQVKVRQECIPTIALLYRLWNFPLLGQGGVARSAGVVRNDGSTSQIGALYMNEDYFGEIR